MPGCTTSRCEYERWLVKSQRPKMTHDACEGEGMTLRLREPRNDAVQALDQFFKSEQLHDVLVEKFGLSEPTNLDAGLHKYLHGYEISPHPDNRQKALTWMFNINPQSDSEDLEIHTYFLRLRPEWSFVKTFWQGNPQADTCWVPWEWCDTVKRQPDNNSVVIFVPSSDTLHAVRLTTTISEGSVPSSTGTFGTAGRSPAKTAVRGLPDGYPTQRAPERPYSVTAKVRHKVQEKGHR